MKLLKNIWTTWQKQNKLVEQKITLAKQERAYIQDVMANIEKGTQRYKDYQEQVEDLTLSIEQLKNQQMDIESSLYSSIESILSSQK